ncbi:MAG TPA: phytoene/squalene synthase family protein [Solirubrobacteraceae bacterium]|nr:phytoene/squalene synthase family protein [Solirubrobacteraceae bacterium]
MRLPRDVRPAVYALYGFVRGADQLVDGPDRPPDPAARRLALDRWQAELEQGMATGRSRHPVIAALVDAGHRHDLPLCELSVYMDSMRFDCGRVRVASRAELDSYMRGSAGAVGLIMAPLLGVPPELHSTVAELGTAFQLTNFIRDVSEDYGLDRVYLPAEDRARLGVSDQDIAARRMTEGFRVLLADEVTRARRLFATTAILDDVVDPAILPGVRLARLVYERVLDRVEALGFDVLRHRVRLPPWQMGAVAVAALSTTGRRTRDPRGLGARR